MLTKAEPIIQQGTVFNKDIPPLASPDSSSSSSISLGRPARTLGLTVHLPERNTLDKVVACIKRREERIVLPNLAPNSQNIPALIAAFNELPNNCNINLIVHQFVNDPRRLPLEDLNKFWDAVKYKVKKVIWDQNKFFTSFYINIMTEQAKGLKLAHCVFQNCDYTHSSPPDSITSLSHLNIQNCSFFGSSLDAVKKEGIKLGDRSKIKDSCLEKHAERNII